MYRINLSIKLSVCSSVSTEKPPVSRFTSFESEQLVLSEFSIHCCAAWVKCVHSSSIHLMNTFLNCNFIYFKKKQKKHYSNPEQGKICKQISIKNLDYNADNWQVESVWRLANLKVTWWQKGFKTQRTAVDEYTNRQIERGWYSVCTVETHWHQAICHFSTPLLPPELPKLISRQHPKPITAELLSTTKPAALSLEPPLPRLSNIIIYRYCWLVS